MAKYKAGKPKTEQDIRGLVEKKDWTSLGILAEYRQGQEAEWAKAQFLKAGVNDLKELVARSDYDGVAFLAKFAEKWLARMACEALLVQSLPVPGRRVE